MEFAFSAEFEKSFQKLDSSIQKDIKEKLIWLSETEYPLHHAKKMRGYKNIYRFRCGDYRILFELSQSTCILLLVQHRKDIYEGL